METRGGSDRDRGRRHRPRLAAARLATLPSELFTAHYLLLHVIHLRGQRSEPTKYRSAVRDLISCHPCLVGHTDHADVVPFCWIFFYILKSVLPASPSNASISVCRHAVCRSVEGGFIPGITVCSYLSRKERKDVCVGAAHPSMPVPVGCSGVSLPISSFGCKCLFFHWGVYRVA